MRAIRFRLAVLASVTAAAVTVVGAQTSPQGDDGFRFKSGVEKTLNQRIGSVIAAGGPTFIPGGSLELERFGIRINFGMKLKQPFVNRAEFFRP